MAEENKATEVVTTQQAQPAPQQKELVTDYSLGLFGTSSNFKMAWQMSQALASSTLVPQHYRENPSNCMIAIDMANRMATSPLAIMQNLNIIQGRPSWSSSALIGMINASRKFDHELRFEEKRDKSGKPYSCRCWTSKRGERIEGIEITMDMANSEGWTSKGGSKWKTMPEVMLRYRSASFFARMNCPEITMGFYTSEEVNDNEFPPYNKEGYEASIKENIAENANSVAFEIEEE